MSFCAILNYYFQYFEQWCGVPQGLLRAIAIQESSFNPDTCDYSNVCNSVGACGLMQIKPIGLADIKRVYGIQLDPMNPVHAIVGAACLMNINRRYMQSAGVSRPSLPALIVAYNGGWTVGRNLDTGKGISNSVAGYFGRVAYNFNSIYA